MESEDRIEFQIDVTLWVWGRGPGRNVPYHAYAQPAAPKVCLIPGKHHESTEKMTFWTEFNSWWSALPAVTVSPPPSIGSDAPNSPKLQLEPGRPTVLAFLRHCGCPFTEKTFLNLREIAKENKDIDFIAISHSDEESTNTWLQSLPQAGSEPSNVRIVIDDKVEIYGAYGLGPSSYAHVLAPASMMSAWRLGRDEGINVRPTESGSRWQTAGTYAVDGNGVVRWGGPAKRADDIPDLNAAVESLRANSKPEAKL